MKKWELARYFIDAKKCVDSVVFITENAEKLRYYGLRELISGKRDSFYINCCAIIEKTVAPSTAQKKSLCAEDPVINSLFRERDKNSAHKDEDYIPQEFDKLTQISDQMKDQILHVKDVCKDYLPHNITLDFVSHDKVFFRAIHKILAEDEEAILNQKYLMRNTEILESNYAQSFSILNDTIDLRSIPEEKKNQYAVLFNGGINWEEGLQEGQDSCIKINLLFNLDTWCSLNKKQYKKGRRLIKLGFLNDFGIIQPLPKDPILLSKIRKVLEE